MTQSTEDRAGLIKKLLNKAESKGTTPAEAEAFNAKALTLMLQWGIDDAMIADADRAKVEQIIQVEFIVACPKSYSFEYTTIGAYVAEQLGCRGLFQKKHNGSTVLLVVGFESDVEYVKVLYRSLALQCTLALGVAYASEVRQHVMYWSGTDRYNWKRSFIRGFASGAEAKLREVRRATVAQSDDRAAVVLYDRAKQVDGWVDANLQLGKTRGRNYGAEAALHGHRAGRSADIGGSQLGTSRKEIGA